MSDTTTKLSLGTLDGDVMDEDLITQPGDGTTQAKRPRVVIAGQTGAAIASPVAGDPGKNPYSLPALAVGLVSDARQVGYIDNELRAFSLTSSGQLRTVTTPAEAYLDFFGDVSPLSTDPGDSTMDITVGFPYGMD